MSAAPVFTARPEPGNKIWLNEQLEGYVASLLFSKNDIRPSDVRALFLESEELNTATMLRRLGVPTSRMSIPNDSSVRDAEGRDQAELIRAQLPEARVQSVSLNDFLGASRRKYDFVFADYCGTVSGRDGHKTPADDLRSLYKGRHVADHAIVAFTFCRRGGSPEELGKFEVTHAREAIGAGHVATCVDRLFYRSMVCVIFYVVRDVRRATGFSRLFVSSARPRPLAPPTPPPPAISPRLPPEDVLSPARERYRIPLGCEIVHEAPRRLEHAVGSTLFYRFREVGVRGHFWATSSVLKVTGRNWVHFRDEDGRKAKLFMRKSDYGSHGDSERAWFIVRNTK